MTDWWYTCRGREVKLTEVDQTALKHGKYFLVICGKCCNVAVTHLLWRREEKEDKKKEVVVKTA